MDPSSPSSQAWLRSKLLLEPEEELPGEHEQFDVHPFWESLARCLKYKEQWRRAHPRAVHVNIGELRAHLLEESRLATNVVSCRQAYALDSQVALGSLVKGRASSKPLNGELMKIIPVVIGSDLYGFYGYWPSKLNRADGPTRDALPDEPDAPLPWWWDGVCNKDYTAFDGWLSALDHDLTKFTKPDESGGSIPLALKTGRAEHAEKVRRKRKGASLCEKREGSVLSLQPETAEKQPGPAKSQLCQEALDILHSFSDRQVFVAPGEQKFLKPGVLDLYSGRCGVARAAIRAGAPWVITFEISRSASEDILPEENKKKILALIRLGAVRGVGSALVCRSFSTAVTPPVRTPRYPRGVPWMSRSMREKVAEGNAMADFQAEVQGECLAAPIPVFFWTENPDSSYLWRQQKFRRRYRHPGSKHLFRADFCRFGTPWRKRTRVATNIPQLMGLRMLCACEKPHVQLRGQHPTLKVPWTRVAQPYPRAFCKIIATALATACGWCVKMDIAGCAMTGTLRIGEAKNPGPRRSLRARNFSLEDTPVQTWTSINIGERRWELFLRWSQSFLSGDPLQLFLQLPLFLAHAIRRYGDLDFTARGSLMYFRHLVLAAQRKVLTLKPFASICWDLASRWEKAEPSQHRPPVPEILVQALVVLSWNLDWRRWSCVTLICFHGVARVGEVLQCKRSDLLLRADMMFESESAFLLLRHSKTMYRQNARVQHLKILSAHVVRLLEKAYCHVCKDEHLFHGSPQVYRQRWDFLLNLLKIPKELKVTPGGLRGGGAVSWYRRGGSIPDLLWIMRLKQIATLESYLQEVSAISLLTDLSPGARHAIRCAASLFWHLDHS